MWNPFKKKNDHDHIYDLVEYKLPHLCTYRFICLYCHKPQIIFSSATQDEGPYFMVASGCSKEYDYSKRRWKYLCTLSEYQTKNIDPLQRKEVFELLKERRVKSWNGERKEFNGN